MIVFSSVMMVVFVTQFAQLECTISLLDGCCCVCGRGCPVILRASQIRDTCMG